MMRAYDDERLAQVYQHGNVLPEESLRAWVAAIAAHARADPAVVEVGAGTGIFCLGFARYSEARRILGVDASVPMLREARLHSRHPLISYVAGTAEALPARAAAFDLALLSRVIHHLRHRRRAAEQLARVLRPGGIAVIRTTFRERLDGLVYEYWPELLAADASRFPSESEVVDDFVASGFEVESTGSVALPVTESLAEYAERLAERPQSKFNALTCGTSSFSRGCAAFTMTLRVEADWLGKLWLSGTTSCLGAAATRLTPPPSPPPARRGVAHQSG